MNGALTEHKSSGVTILHWSLLGDCGRGGLQGWPPGLSPQREWMHCNKANTMKVVVIAGTHSGVGKTSLAVGLMAALRCGC